MDNDDIFIIILGLILFIAAFGFGGIIGKSLAISNMKIEAVCHDAAHYSIKNGEPCWEWNQ